MKLTVDHVMLPPANLIHPQCGKCGHAVKEIEVRYGRGMRGGVYVLARCHGEEEDFFIPASVLVEIAQEAGISVGVAFAGEKPRALEDYAKALAAELEP